MSSWVKYMHIYISIAQCTKEEINSQPNVTLGAQTSQYHNVLYEVDVHCFLVNHSQVDRVQRLLSLQGSLHKALLKPEKIFQETIFLVESCRTNPEPLKNEFLAILTEIKISHCKQVKVTHSLLKTKDLHSLDLISARSWMTHYSLEILQSYCCDTGSQNRFLLILY